MAANNQLRARLDRSLNQHIEQIADSEDVDRTEVERAVIEEGLASLGYLERPTAAHELLLWYVNQMGLVLGFVGLILVGYGVFGPRSFSVMGFGLTVAGFLGVALAEFLPRVFDSGEAGR